MVATLNPNAIGIEYKIDIQKLANSISIAKKQLEHFHKDLAELAKKASVTITIKDQQAKAQVKKFTTAIQAELDKTGMLKIKAVTEGFGKIGGNVPRLTKDYEALYKKFGESPELLGKMNNAFKRVNDTIGEQAIRMQNAGRNGLGFYQTANRVSLVQQELSGKLKATSTGFRNVALETKQAALAQRELATVTVSVSSQLSSMGISSSTTVGHLKKMNLSALDNSRALTLVQSRMKELQTGMIGGGKATKAASDEFTRLQGMMPHLEHESNKGVKAFGDYRRAMDRWSGGFKYMMLSQAAWIASGAVLFGTLTAIGTGFKDMIAYHQGMKGLEAVTKANAEEMKMMEDTINDTAVATKFFAGDMTKAAYIMAQAGFSAKEVSAGLGGIALLASAANSSLEDTADLMTTVIRAYELNASDSIRIANVLAAGIVKSKLEISDLRTAFNYMGVAAHQFNLSIEDTVAWLGILRDRGLKASTIGTSFRMVLATLVSETKKLNTVLKNLKEPLGFSDITIRNGRKVEDTMERLAKAGFKVTDAFIALPKRTAMTFSLMVQNTGAFRKMREEIDGTNTAVEMNVTQMKGMEYQLRQIKAIFTEIFRSLSEGGGVFEGFISSIRFVIQQIGAIAIYVNSLFQRILNEIVAVAAIIAEKFKNIPTNISEAVIYVYKKFGQQKVAEGADWRDLLEPGEATPIKPPDKEKDTGFSAYTQGILDQLEKDNQKIADETYKTLQRILSPEIRTPAEIALKKIKDELNKLRTEQKELEDEWDKLGDKGSKAALEIFGKLSLVNEQIRALEESAGKFNDAIQGPVDSLKDIMLRMVIKPGMKLEDLLNVFKKGEDSIKIMEEAIKELRDDADKALAAAIKGNLSSDTEEVKRLLATAEKLAEAEKKLAELKDKRLKAEVKKKDDAIKAAEKELDILEKQVREEYDAALERAKIREKNAEDAKKATENMIKEAEKELDILEKQVREEYDAALERAKIREKNAEDARTAPEQFAEGMKDGFKKAQKTLANEYTIWKDLTENAAMSMRDTFSDMFFDSMRDGLKSLSDYWQLFSRAVRREIANMAAAWLTSGLLGTDKKTSWLKTIFTKAAAAIGSSGGESAGGYSIEANVHKGGWIKRMHGGGVNLKNDESIRVLKNGEYVIKDSSAQSLGGSNLDYMNRTGRMPSGGQTVKHYNSYTIFAMDSESVDQALRRGGAKAISEISMNNYARERERQHPATRRF